MPTQTRSITGPQRLSPTLSMRVPMQPTNLPPSHRLLSLKWNPCLWSCLETPRALTWRSQVGLQWRKLGQMTCRQGCQLVGGVLICMVAFKTRKPTRSTTGPQRLSPTLSMRVPMQPTNLPPSHRLLSLKWNPCLWSCLETPRALTWRSQVGLQWRKLGQMTCRQGCQLVGGVLICMVAFKTRKPVGGAFGALAWYFHGLPTVLG
mmetsp:Transcript_28936/g.36305  ORF Transcript_28936/g.36305 Transcript_28936/m.36305 type:complete len:205 (+) Transcript_28936:420-1034(+)